MDSKQRDLSTNRATRFFFFFKRRLHISHQEFKIEKKKRFCVAYSSSRRNGIVESAEPITFRRSNFFSLRFVTYLAVALFTSNNRERMRFCDSVRQKSPFIIYANDSIFSFTFSLSLSFCLNYFILGSTPELFLFSYLSLSFLFIYLSLSFAKIYTILFAIDKFNEL